MQLEPTALDRPLDAGAELLAGGFELVEERRIDLLDTDASVLHGLDASGDLDELARCGFRVGVGTFGGELHKPALARLAACSRRKSVRRFT
ncbi:hypothetical protein Q2941_42835, partial [Bradyrhizobium sp. UFLA05-153]